MDATIHLSTDSCYNRTGRPAIEGHLSGKEKTTLWVTVRDTDFGSVTLFLTPEQLGEITSFLERFHHEVCQEESFQHGADMEARLSRAEPWKEKG